MSTQIRMFPVTEDVNYGSSKTSTTVNTALNPQNLAEGAVGIYGIDPSSTNNAHKLALITDAGSDAAGLVPNTAFDQNGQIVFAVGTAADCIVSGAFDVSKITMTSQLYVAGVKSVKDVGYTPNATTGLLNEAATILRGDELQLKVVNVTDNNELDSTGRSYSGYANVDSASMYDIIADMIVRVDDDASRDVEVDLTSNGTPTYITSTADPTLVNGSINVTFAADPTFSVGDTIVLRGFIYKIAVENTSTDYDLDRIYKGVSETIDVSTETTVMGTMASIIEYGFTVTDKEFDVETKIAVGELIQSASKTESTAFVGSNGSGAKVAAEELAARPKFGNMDQNDRNVPIKPALTDTTLNYDQYSIRALNSRKTSDPHSSNGNSEVLMELVMAFRNDVADTGGKNQSNFEDVLIGLGVSVEEIV